MGGSQLGGTEPTIVPTSPSSRGVCRAGGKGVQVSLSNGHPSGGIWVKAHGKRWLGVGKKRVDPVFGLVWHCGTPGVLCLSFPLCKCSCFAQSSVEKNPHPHHQLHQKLPTVSSHPQRLVIFFYEDKARFRNCFTRCISLCGTPKVS